MILRFVVILGILFSTGFANAGTSDFYFEIQKRAIKWNDGLFGSTLFHERELSDYLYSVTGKIIETPYDYAMFRPYEIGRQALQCRFYYTEWIQIRGSLSEEEIKKIAFSERKSSLEWERSGVMVKLSGKLRKFRLDRSSNGKRLIIFLDEIKISDRTSLPDNKKTGTVK